ncbi:MAG: murein biosynthesis integral membrane protein MurJ [Chitinispirillaceae bacterium]|nr:murein biosynthesis integral membrane protein MurJ [Chitinispirillaceae bacterium]
MSEKTTDLMYNSRKAKPAASGDRSLSIATVIMMGSVLLSRVIGLFREVFLAKYGGTSFEMDAYVTAFIIPELLNHFLAGGFLSITFIPIFQRHLIDNRHDKAWESFSNLLCIGSLLFLMVIPVTMITAPDILSMLGPHIREPKSYLLTVKLTRIILPAQLFFYWGAFLSAVQMSHKRFFLPALAPLGYNGGIILGGILLGPRMGIEGFAWGVLFGAFFGNVVLQLPGAIGCGMKFIPRFDVLHPDVICYVKKTVPLILGLSMVFSNEVFFRFFGSFLPEGGTSSVNYALRTMMMIVAVFGQASGVAFYPFLSQLAAEKKFDAMGSLLNTFLRNIALYLIPLSAVLMVLSRPVIALLYERGRFNAQSSIETAPVFTIYLIGSFSFSAAMIVARSFYAMQNMVIPMVVSTGISLVTIPLYLVFSRVLGARGIALAAILGITLQCGILYGIWSWKHGSRQGVGEELVLLTKIIVVTALAAIPALLMRQWVASHITFENAFLRNGCIVTGVALPMLGLIFFLYDRMGLQRFKESLGGFIRRK